MTTDNEAEKVFGNEEVIEWILFLINLRGACLAIVGMLEYYKVLFLSLYCMEYE